jgi:hypothetical protein
MIKFNGDEIRPGFGAAEVLCKVKLISSACQVPIGVSVEPY